MKPIFLLSLIIIPTFIFSQQINFTTSYGYSVGKMQHYKKIMLARSTYLSYESKITNKINYNIGLGVLKTSFNDVDRGFGSYYASRTYAFVPITLKRSWDLSKFTTTYLEFGVSTTYCVSDKKIYADQAYGTVHKKNLGVAFGGIANVGISTMVMPMYLLDVCFGSQADYGIIYKKDNEVIKNNSIYIKFGISRML